MDIAVRQEGKQQNNSAKHRFGADSKVLHRVRAHLKVSDRNCASFLKNVATLTLLSAQVNVVPSKSIEKSHYKRGKEGKGLADRFREHLRDVEKKGTDASKIRRWCFCLCTYPHTYTYV